MFKILCLCESFDKVIAFHKGICSDKNIDITYSIWNNARLARVLFFVYIFYTLLRCGIFDFFRIIFLILRKKILIIPNHITSSDGIKKLKNLKQDIGLHATRAIYTKEVISSFSIGILNAHIGILPKYRGRSVMEWSLLNEDETGITTFIIDSGIDTGPRIIHKAYVNTLNKKSITYAKNFLFKKDVEMYKYAIMKIFDNRDYVYMTQLPQEGIRYYVMSDLFLEIVNQIRERNRVHGVMPRKSFDYQKIINCQLIKSILRRIKLVILIYKFLMYIKNIITFYWNTRNIIYVSLNDVNKILQDVRHILPCSNYKITPLFTKDSSLSLLGSPLCRIQNITWNKDVSSGIEWSYTIPSFLISYGTGRSEDIKVPWEFSRMYFLPQIAFAYSKENNDYYAKQCIEILSDWISKNKYYYGPNWMNAMEVGIRVSNWCVTFWLLRPFFEKNQDIYTDFLKLFINSCWQHGKYIIDNLEYGPTISNHYLANLVGLLYISIIFPLFNESEIWRKKAISGLEECMKRQVYDDGVDFESSIPYHRLVTELFGYATRIGIYHSISFSEEYMSKLEKMFDFCWHYTKPNNQAPQIGDNDSGRLHIFEKNVSEWNINDHTHLFPLGLELWPEKKWPEKKSILFPKAQIAIMRSKNIHCIIDGGSNGQDGNGGHCHNDVGSFELNVYGKDFIIDPGTYVYTGDHKARNLFRSTKMHNTVCIDNEEQNRIPSFDKGLFWMYDDVRPKIKKWNTNQFMDIFSIEHFGYKRLSDPIIHNRIFRFDKKEEMLEIIDNFFGYGEHILEWNFILHPSVLVNMYKGKVILSNEKIKLYLKYPDMLSCIISDIWVSPEYGRRIKSKKIIFPYIIDRNNSFKFIVTTDI